MRASKSRQQTTSSLQPDPVIEAYKKDIDRTLIRENLRLTVEQRFENLMRLQEFAAELLKAGARADKHGNNVP